MNLPDPSNLPYLCVSQSACAVGICGVAYRIVSERSNYVNFTEIPQINRPQLVHSFELGHMIFDILGHSELDRKYL